MTWRHLVATTQLHDAEIELPCDHGGAVRIERLVATLRTSIDARRTACAAAGRLGGR